MTTTPETLDLEDRRAIFASLEGLRRQIDLLIHHVIDQPTDPIPDLLWQLLMQARLEMGAITARWIH